MVIEESTTPLQVGPRLRPMSSDAFVSLKPVTIQHRETTGEMEILERLSGSVHPGNTGRKGGTPMSNTYGAHVRALVTASKRLETLLVKSPCRMTLAC